MYFFVPYAVSFQIAHRHFALHRDLLSGTLRLRARITNVTSTVSKTETAQQIPKVFKGRLSVFLDGRIIINASSISTTKNSLHSSSVWISFNITHSLESVLESIRSMASSMTGDFSTLTFDIQPLPGTVSWTLHPAAGPRYDPVLVFVEKLHASLPDARLVVNAGGAMKVRPRRSMEFSSGSEDLGCRKSRNTLDGSILLLAGRVEVNKDEGNQTLHYTVADNLVVHVCKGTCEEPQTSNPVPVHPQPSSTMQYFARVHNISQNGFPDEEPMLLTHDLQCTATRYRDQRNVIVYPQNAPFTASFLTLKDIHADDCGCALS